MKASYERAMSGGLEANKLMVYGPLPVVPMNHLEESPASLSSASSSVKSRKRKAESDAVAE